MPLHDDEMKRRQEKREAMRKKQQVQARKLRIRLILTALAVALCIGGIGYLAANREELGIASPSKETEPVVQTEESLSPLLADPITTIHIKAAGDLNVTDSVVSSGVAAVGYDFTGVFRDVAAVLSDADLTVMNFEGNICGEPYGTATTSAPIELIQALRNAGVDILQMANSCSINNGLNGLTSTLNAIRGAGIEPIGAYASDREFKSSKGYTIVEIQGIRIAIVAFTKGMGGRGMPVGNENLVNLLYVDYDSEYREIDRDRITSILQAANAEKPDLTIAMIHWGSEYNDDISRTQESIVTLMQKQGVDVILGTHPHMVQPIDYDPISGTLVAYSLGDFFGSATRAGTNYSIILDLEITRDSTTGVTRVSDYSYTPIYTVKQGESAGDYAYDRVMRIDMALEAHYGNFLDKISDSTESNMKYSLTRIEDRLIMPEEED